MTDEADRMTNVLLALPSCATSSATRLARSLGLPRGTVTYHIQRLQEKGLVTGYTPTVTPRTFGDPYLVRVSIDPRQYEIREDLEATVIALRDFLLAGIRHAPLSLYVYQDQEDNALQVNCVTMTTDIKLLVESIYREQNIAKEIITTIPLNEAYGFPMYSKFSLGGHGIQTGGE